MKILRKVDSTGIRPKLVAELSASEIDADLFLPAASRRPSAPARQGRSGGGGGKGAKATAAPPAKAERWSEQPFDLALLRRFDAEASLRIAAVSYGNIRVDRPEITLQLANGVIEISRVSGEVFGGTFQSGARLAALDAAEAERRGSEARGEEETARRQGCEPANVVNLRKCPSGWGWCTVSAPLGL